MIIKKWVLCIGNTCVCKDLQLGTDKENFLVFNGKGRARAFLKITRIAGVKGLIIKEM